MNEKMFTVRFLHPLNDTTLQMALPVSMTFGEILKLLYRNGFLQKKTADYGFITGRRLCALNKPLSGYIPPETTDVVEIEINGMLSIMS